MNAVIRLVVAVGVLLSGVLSAPAGSCGVFYPSSTVYSPSYVAPVVVEQKVVKQIVFEMIPPYAVGYAPAYAAPAMPAPAMPAPAAPSPCSAEVQSLRQELERLKAAIAPAAPPPMAPVPEKPAAPKPTMLGQKCAVCHDVATAATKGGKLTLFEGGAPTAWTPEMFGKVIREVASGRMPKGGPRLTQEEFSELMQSVMDLASK